MPRSPIILIAACLAYASALAPSYAQSTAPAQLETDVVYGHKDGLAMTMDVYRPDDHVDNLQTDGAAVLFIVSGGWYSTWAPPENTRRILDPYLNAGYTTIAIRHGSSPRYAIPDAVADVRQAVRFVRQNAERLQIDADRLGVLGMSAGGHLALMVGATGDDGDPNAKNPLEKTSSRVAAVVALVPPTDLRVAVWEAPESLPAYRGFPALNLPLDEAAKQSPLVHVTADDAPSLVIMGGEDKLVPAAHGEWIDKAFAEQGVPHKLVVFSDAGHGLGGDANREKLLSETLGWFGNYLGAK